MVPKVIVVGCDLSDGARVVVEAGFVMARKVGAERVHLVHVLDKALSLAYAFPNSQSVEKHQLARVEERLAGIKAPDIEVTYEARWGIPSRDLALVADEQGAGLIVVASHGRGLVRRAVLGSVSASLVRTARVPVLVVGPNREPHRFDNVLVAVDLSPVSRNVIRVAEAYAPDAITVISAYEPPFVSGDDLLPGALSPEDRAELRRKYKERLESFGHPVTLLDGLPAPSILEAASTQDADLVVVGTSGHNAWERAFLGSTATRVLSSAPCPVLVVPFEGES